MEDRVIEKRASLQLYTVELRDGVLACPKRERALLVLPEGSAIFRLLSAAGLPKKNLTSKSGHVRYAHIFV